MLTDTKEHIDEKLFEKNDTQHESEYALILCNDDFNTFDYVTETLINICKHSPEQAQQCAYITHYKGSCDIKIGNFEKLYTIKTALLDKGLSAIIEKL